MASKPYDTSYYARTRAGSSRSAEAVVPIVLDLIEPRSVVDVGCGAGGWLRVFNEHGVEDILGVDGDYVDRSQLEIPEERFRPADLEQGVQLDRRFDLAVSLEVAEHLPAGAGDKLVASLAALAPAILFSAAIPGQGGANHVNEQWPDYWVGRFHEAGYVTVDCIRPRIWGNPQVQTWYAQNTLLLVEPALFEAHPKLAAERERRRDNPLSVVHPLLVNRWPPRMMIRRLHRLGLLTDDEFEAKRAAVEQWERAKGYA